VIDPFPNWRDREAYPGPHTYEREGDAASSSMLWAWQFLRRSPEYQAAYTEYRSRPHGTATSVAPGRFGLAFFLPFSWELPEYVPFTGSLAPLVCTPWSSVGATRWTINLAHGQVGVVLDLSSPLNRQLEELRSQLERTVRPPRKRKRYDALGRYLRVLDALRLGTSNTTIAAHFVAEGTYAENENYRWKPGDKALERDLARARYLMMGKYLELLRS
jgi:hypothetical protein